MAIAVIVIVVFVVIGGILAAVLFGVQRPVVAFGTPSAITDGFQFPVTSASKAFGPDFFRVNLQVDSSLGTSVPLAASMAITVGGSSYATGWVDPGRERLLNVGDRFAVTRPGGLPPVTTFTFFLLWSDGSMIQSLEYQSPKPVITFGTTTAISSGFQFPVAGASQSVPAANYRVNLKANTSFGTAVTLASSMTIAIGPTTYSIAWLDLGGDVNLNAGDQFQVTHAGGLPGATVFTFYLLWSDASTIQIATYTTP